ncbi:PREDICTED: uncharacterized protein LOC109580188 [Amphimedon queenslandica]|uniref:NIDO domain-containing protein n=1 Tax=Amphimedon queenslandica TaxID=400682 RepID=A0A1X7VHV2_AMPQE|nr:PREDICTED: uncharacterized protein LOC109580188 [Amphimedon queenslandica]|eukprot:XP_019848645.1 PREDICTED: uncharacterized protein LOC109580188 [Amphimedon queenslandica]
MMIVFVILIYFNGLLVSSEGNYLPFLNPTDYSILNGYDDYAINVSFPSLIRFGSSCYTDAWISTNGLISLGTRYTNHDPNLFPISIPVIAPYWDDSDLTGRGEVRYAVITPATNLSLCNQVNDYLSTSTGSSVSVEWILWAYWYDVCPYGNYNCRSIESNHFQVVLAFQSNATYAVFIYKYGLIRWTRNEAGVGINSGDGYYINHPLSNTDDVINIDCNNVVSRWNNVVYRLDQGQHQVIDKFEFLSITSHSITVSWELSIPAISSTLILSVTDDQQTVNDKINVAGYDSHTYSYSKDDYLCNVYTFKLTLPATTKGCNNDNKLLSTAMTPIPQNISALYLFQETLIIKLKMNWCHKNEIYIELLLSVNKTFNVSKSLHINNLHQFYTTKWNIKLNRHSLYYLTVTAIGMYKTNTSNATEISMHNVRDIIIKRNEDISCFICVTEIFNNCQVLVASARTTLIP